MRTRMNLVKGERAPAAATATPGWPPKPIRGQPSRQVNSSDQSANDVSVPA